MPSTPDVPGSRVSGLVDELMAQPPLELQPPVPVGAVAELAVVEPELARGKAEPRRSG